MAADHRVTSLEAGYSGLQEDMSELRRQNQGVLEKVSDMARSFKDLAAFVNTISADKATKDERWRNHEKDHERIEGEVKNEMEFLRMSMDALREKVHKNSLGIAKAIGLGGLGGGVATLVGWILEKLL